MRVSESSLPKSVWAGRVLREGEPYGGSGEYTCSPKRFAEAGAIPGRFRQLIKKGVTECNHIAEAMGLPKYTVSRMAKRAKKAGWLDKVERKYVIVNARK